VKKTGRDEPVGVVIHTCMETTQGNSLCLYLKLAKHHVPLFIFYVFSSTKSENRRAEQVLWWGDGVGGLIRCKSYIYILV
jgi:hypothetical protein